MSSIDSSDNQLLKVDTLQRVRISEGRKEALLDEFGRSTLSAAAFAKLHGLKYSTFAAWARKRRHQDHETTTAAPLSLAEIIVNDPPSTTPSPWPHHAGPCLHLPGGAWLDLGSQADCIQAAAQLIKALKD